MKFQRAIGPIGLLLAGIGGVIGSGWLLGPLYAAQYAGPAAVLSWVIGGILMIVIALTFAELGTAFPISGGMIHYALNSHGLLMSFLIGWMVWISSVAIAPVETLAIVQYAANYVPGLVTISDHVPVLSAIGILIAAVIMFFMCFLNYYGARFFSKSNSLITIFKLLVPTVTIVILLFSSFHTYNFTSAQYGGFLPYGWHGVMASLPLGGVIYSFIGANTVLQLAGEIKNPQYSIPIALIGSMLFCILLYSLLQLTFTGSISPSVLAQGWNQLHFPGDMGPFGGLMSSIGLGWFVYLIYADAIISPFGTGYVFTASTSRIGHGLSEINFFPKSLQKLTKRGVPLRSLILNYFIGLLLFLPFPGWQKLATFIISCFIVSYIIGPLALISLRHKFPDIKRPFYLPYAKIIAPLAFYICNLLIYWTGWQTVSKIILLLGIGVIYFVYISYKAGGKPLAAIVQSTWLWIYFTILAFISYFGSFGGGTNQIKFGVDFIFIAILSCLVYFLATRSVIKSDPISSEVLETALKIQKEQRA